jgi:hypothetical protein
MDKPQSKLPVNRRKPIGRSFSASDVDKLVKSARNREKAVASPPVSDGLGGTKSPSQPKKRSGDLPAKAKAASSD